MLWRTSHSRSENTIAAVRRLTRLSVRSTGAVGAIVISLLGTSALAAAPASASTNPLGSLLTTVTSTVTSTVTTTLNAATAPLTAAPTNAPAAACPALPAPTDEGGIGSIYPLLPLFGPLSSEAFVWLPLLQTLVPLVAPLLPLAQQVLVSAQPELNVLLPVFENVLNSGYAVIGPEYAPYRQQVLNAEQQLVNLFLPFAQGGTTLPGAACLAPLEGIIVTDLDLSAAAGTLS
jgi:hypothetical protein